jgi:long-chain acyl-CoA synthetase
MRFRHFGDYMQHLEAHGERLALINQPFLKIERYDFEHLCYMARQTAHYLRSLGIRKGDRIMIIAVNSPQWVVLFLGAQLIGAVVVPVDARSNAEAAYEYAKQTNPKLVFKNERLLPDLERTYVAKPLEKLDRLVASFPDEPLAEKLDGSETAVIVFTSGTTAAPKGVVLTQQNILANISGVADIITITPDWSLLSVLPLSHMFELTASLTVFAYGASIAYLTRVTPLTIAKGLKHYRPTTLLAVPELLIVLLERVRQTAEATGKGRLLRALFAVAGHLPFAVRRTLFASVHREFGGRLHTVVCGGAPVPVATAEAWERMGVRIVQGYGLTETSPILTVNGLKERRLDSQGMILPNVRLRIAKSDGEIQAKGPSVFSGYWLQPDATKAAFTRDEWFKTGDIGRVEGGWLHIQGRAKFTIVLSSGLKVFPEDVELAAYGNEALKALCIVGVKHTEGETVEAVLISDRDDAAVKKAIAEVNAGLQPFQHITGWQRWPEADFPRTRLLKIDRKAVQAWANEEPSPATDEKAASQPDADPLTECIRLSVDKPHLVIRTDDKLTDLGLDSLRRLNLVSLLEEQLSIVIDESAITATTTVGQLRTLTAKNPANHQKTAPEPSWPLHPAVRFIGNLLRDSLLGTATGIWVSQRTVGVKNLPDPTQPAIYMFNHVDNFDGPVAFRALPRRLRNRLAVAQAADFMAEHRVVAAGARLCYTAFDFARQAPFLPSLEYTAKLVDEGWSIAMFPEGKIARTPRLRPFKSGIGLLAVELGVPIVPVKTEGLYGTLPLHAKWPRKRSHVTITIGKPVTFAPNTSYDEATGQLEKRMRDL